MSALCLIPHSIHQGHLVLHYLSRGDATWVRFLLDEYLRFSGRPRRELVQRLREPLPAHIPKKQSRVVIKLLDRIFYFRPEVPIAPQKIRAVVFKTAAKHRQGFQRNEILKKVSETLNMPAEKIADILYADIPEEQKLVSPKSLPSPAELVGQANLFMAQNVFRRSCNLIVEVSSSVRPVVRTARLLGLLCHVERLEEENSTDHTFNPDLKTSALHHGLSVVQLNISGPISLFHNTLKYGEALARLLPVVVRVPRWNINAECSIKNRRLLFTVSDRDHLLPNNLEPKEKLFDSNVEERFYRDFIQTAPEWEILREPEPLCCEGAMIFPDFAISHRNSPEKRVFVEIIGFWTPEYLEKKMAFIQKTLDQKMILCVKKSLACGEKNLPSTSEIIRYGTRVPAKKVLESARKLISSPLYQSHNHTKSLHTMLNHP